MSMSIRRQSIRIAWSAAALLIVSLFMGTFAMANGDGIPRGIDADAARYAALGEYYATSARGAEADSARWAALGRSYPGAVLAAGAGQALDDSVLATNPELSLARMAYSAPALGTCAPSTADDVLAANPELLAVRSSAFC